MSYVVDQTAVAEVVEKVKTLELTNIDAYKDAISQFRLQIKSLVESGNMSQQIAAQLINEYEYKFFQQLVIIQYN